MTNPSRTVIASVAALLQATMLLAFVFGCIHTIPTVVSAQSSCIRFAPPDTPLPPGNPLALACPAGTVLDHERTNCSSIGNHLSMLGKECNSDGDCGHMSWYHGIMQCYRGVCDLPHRFLGDRCVDGKQCSESQSKCIDGLCRYVDIGDWCWYGISNCDPKKAYCSMRLERKCVPKLRIGMTGCEDAQDNDNACEVGAHCVANKCVAWRMEGDVCDGTDATACYADFEGRNGPRLVLNCVDGRCRNTFAQVGETCSTADKPCDPIKGLVCNGGRCIPMNSVAEGGSCDFTIACANGTLCVDGRCVMLPTCETNDDCPLGAMCVTPSSAASSEGSCRGKCVDTSCTREGKALQDCLLANCNIPSYHDGVRPRGYRWDPNNCPNIKCGAELRAQSQCRTRRIQAADPSYREGKQPGYN